MIKPDTGADEVWVTARGRVRRSHLTWSWAELTHPAPYPKDVAFVARFGEQWFLLPGNNQEPQEFPSKEAALLAARITS